ncbi:GNAT family N-acetyltransferase [Pseudooceanicola aestuarii]|uniref:GNAT family N-acetyltransferase n=1 Tax=Pseudooceanicola aestuarii TaxID=2697319 RepID=UPI0013D68E3B|nr:N-acetyltransferase [Pseudooceanicola aestuarii]
MARRAQVDIRKARPEDESRVQTILTEAFGGPAEARLVTALRRDRDLTVERVAIIDGQVAGYIGFSLHRSPRDWMCLAPVAVLPAQQGRGIGAELVRYGLDAARRKGARAITVLGDGRFYRRFGFTYAAAENLGTPYDPAHTLLYPIAPGTAFAAERLSYAAAFDS